MYDDPELLTEAKLAELERFFAPLAALLQAFAERHNLRIDKYHRAQANWSFIFRLVGEGTIGHIQVLRVGDNQVLIAGHRERRDFEGFRRFISRGGVATLTLSRDDPRFAEELESMLVRTVSHPDSRLVSDGIDWSTRSREENDLSRRLFAAEPLVRLDH
jgi:hypothetical protein